MADPRNAKRSGMAAPASEESGGSSRPARSRRLGSAEAIREAAARLLLEKGYQATSMDDVAAAARVSKQTIYTHFANKEELFRDLVLGNAARVSEFAGLLAPAAEGDADVASRLHALGRRYVAFVVRPEVVQLRRLVIGEAARFPTLAQAYFEQVTERTYALLADLFRDLADRGELAVDDPLIAAYQFAWLTLGRPLDRAMLLGASDPGAPDTDAIVDAGVRTFLAAYGREERPG
jgi:TetR/AcrR family transcriptional repressor of mexJK operon